MPAAHDVQVLRGLAERYIELCEKPIQNERRGLWRRHNALQRTRPLIYARWLAAWHEAEESKLECEDPFFRAHETSLRQGIYQDTIGDDSVLEPWITQPATRITPPEGVWGAPYGRIPSNQPGGGTPDPDLKEPDWGSASGGRGSSVRRAIYNARRVRGRRR